MLSDGVGGRRHNGTILREGDEKGTRRTVFTVRGRPVVAVVINLRTLRERGRSEGGRPANRLNRPVFRVVALLCHGGRELILISPFYISFVRRLLAAGVRGDIRFGEKNKLLLILLFALRFRVQSWVINYETTFNCERSSY